MNFSLVSVASHFQYGRISFSFAAEMFSVTKPIGWVPTVLYMYKPIYCIGSFRIERALVIERYCLVFGDKQIL